MKLIAIAAAAATLIATPALAEHGKGNARSGAESPTADNMNPSSCLGQERATRNSRGGDRPGREFGEAQSSLARQQAQDDTRGGFGQQTLQPFLDGCEYSPGDMEDDG